MYNTVVETDEETFPTTQSKANKLSANVKKSPEFVLLKYWNWTSFLVFACTTQTFLHRPKTHSQRQSRSQHYHEPMGFPIDVNLQRSLKPRPLPHMVAYFLECFFVCDTNPQLSKAINHYTFYILKATKLRIERPENGQSSCSHLSQQNPIIEYIFLSQTNNPMCLKSNAHHNSTLENL